MKEMEAAPQVRVGNEPKTIKRYANRKLYDTAESRYVTLDEIATMVKQGVEVRIVDNRTKEDLTSITLAQIIFEEEKKKSRMPLSLLRQIIRQPSELISGFIQKEVTPRVTSIREEAESRLDKLLRREEGVSEGLSAKFEDWQRRVDERVKQGIESVVGNLPALGRDFQQLKQRLEELEKKIDELERQGRGP